MFSSLTFDLPTLCKGPVRLSQALDKECMYTDKAMLMLTLGGVQKNVALLLLLEVRNLTSLCVGHRGL